MHRLLLISILFVFSNSFSQNFSETFSDTTITAYDLLLIKSKIDNENELLAELNDKINFYQQKVLKTQRTIDSYKSKIESYSDIYSNLLVHFYFVGLNLKTPSIFLLSSDSFNQAFKRYNYLKMLISFIIRVGDYLILINEQLENELSSYQKYSQSLDLFLENYQEKKVNLDIDVKTALFSAKKLEQNAQEIRSIIVDNYSNYKVLDKFLVNTSLSVETNNSLFENLSLPLYNSIIISSFGNHNHPYLKNVVITNDGIDLFSDTDTIVKSVFEGEVVYIVDVPNFGKSIILKHNVYYTVYSNLNLVYVHDNQKIFSNQKIGTISSNSSKYSFACLNFQIWKNTQKLNPVDFLNLTNE